MAASVSAKRAALAGLAESRRGGPSSGQVVRTVAIGIVVLGLLALVMMWLFGFFSAPPEVRAVQALVDEQIQQLQRVARNESQFEEGSFGPMFETMRQVPREYREQAGREMGRLFEAREKAEVNSYFSMPPEQRIAEMDRRLNGEAQRWQAWDAQRPAQGGGRGRPPGGLAGGPGGSGGPVNTGGSGGRGGTPGGQRTEESRNMRSKSRIDSSSAEARARGLEYRRVKEQRRVELGLPARGGRRG